MHILIVGGWVGSKSLHPIPKIIRTLVVTDDPLSKSIPGNATQCTAVSLNLCFIGCPCVRTSSHVQSHQHESLFGDQISRHVSTALRISVTVVNPNPQRVVTKLETSCLLDVQKVQRWKSTNGSLLLAS
jgi:hypothetical protein